MLDILVVIEDPIVVIPDFNEDLIAALMGLDPVLIVEIEGLDPLEVVITGFIVSLELS